MRLRFGHCVFILACGAFASWACSLNPQPLPPDTDDAATNSDGSLTLNAPDSAAGAPDAATYDSSPPPPEDAAATDASEDAGDASDASSDATMDARDDG